MRRERLLEDLELVFPLPRNPGDGSGVKRVKADRLKSEFYFDQGARNQAEAVAGSLWAAYNGIAEYVDHHRGKSGANRLNSGWFGDGYLIKARAFDIAMDNIKTWAA